MAVTTTARAAPSARLVYVREKGAEECPDEAAVRAAVSTRLGYDPFSPDAQATLFAEVTREASTYHARIKLVDDANVVRGARELDHTGPRCADLVDAMALTISIAIDPRSLTGPAPEPEPAPALPTAPAPAPVPGPAAPPPAAAAAPAPVPVPLELVASLSPTVSFGSAPAPAVGLVGGVGVAHRPFGVWLEARGDLPASRDVTLGTVSTSFVAGTIAPCLLRGVFFGCGVVTAGRLVAEARGIRAPRTDHALHALAGARLGVAEPLTNTLDLRVNVDVFYTLTPQLLRIDARDAYELPRLSAQVGLGLALHFL